MASARPSSYRGGGGLFSGDGVITGYRFTDEWNGRPYDPTALNPTTKKPAFHWLYCDLTVRFDKAPDKPVTKSFKVGAADEWVIEDDGHTLTPLSEDQALNRTAEWQIIVDTLCATSFDENLLPEDRVNYEPIIGARVKFGERRNERLAAAGKKQLNKKTGKEYEYRDVVVEQFYGFVGAANGKPASTRSTSKTNGSGGVETLADETLLAILAKNGGSVIKTKLSMESLKQLQSHPQREDVRKLYASDSYLQRNAGWEYDKQSGVVAAV